MHPTDIQTTKYGTIILPNKHLSYSAIDLWYKNKDDFRKAYYQGIRRPDTMFTMFGRYVHARIDTDPSFADIRLPISEHPLEFTVAGIPIVAYVDTFVGTPTKGAPLFGEYKTGIRNKDGKAPWTQSAVDKHNQLVVYSLGLQTTLKLGKGSHDCYLVWLETEKKKKTQKIGSVELVLGEELVLTGDRQRFERTIYEFERKMIREWIIEAALAISEDFKSCQQVHS